MKIKLILALTALLIILMFIIFFLGQWGHKTVSLPENLVIENKQVPKETQKWQWPISQTPSPQQKLPIAKIPPSLQQQLPTAQMLSPQRAITIIEEPNKKNKVLPVILDRENKKKISESSSSSETTTEADTEKTSLEPEAGITIINKQPTTEEKKEMNAKGIIIY